ncbi:MAG: hypothetical protein JO003_01350 [Candidatus Eremiobacteraeota bacterium]|nr:hypothetical protein [Candidatus Eremiobacteraeota bacterium]
MRAVLYGAAALALATLTSPDTIRTALASAASALVEATPFIFAGVALASVLRRSGAVVAHLGCGCAGGPSARSLPAAAATWLLFGPFVATARYAAAILVTRVLRRVRGEDVCRDAQRAHPLAELRAVLPAALLGGACAQIFAGFDPARLSPVEGAAIGAALGFGAAGCGLGAVALAAALRVHAPAMAAAFLCVAGIVDLRALRVIRAPIRTQHDALAYVLLAAATALIASRNGDALVHPALVLPLWGCALAAVFSAARYRRAQCATARFAPSLMLLGALIGAPPPAYHATETTLTQLFAGERLTFTGVLSCENGTCGLVRYAITCCRADAAPVVVRLSVPPREPAGTWLRATGRIDESHGDLRLVAQSLELIPPPPDPFIYR